MEKGGLASFYWTDIRLDSLTVKTSVRAVDGPYEIQRHEFQIKRQRSVVIQRIWTVTDGVTELTYRHEYTSPDIATGLQNIC